MKIIFLDIDGVLNHQAFYSKRYELMKAKNYSVEHPLSEFCPDSINNLNTLIAETDAKVVISSTWRMGRTVDELQSILNCVGFIGEVIGCTPNLKGDDCMRGNEIHKWIKDACKTMPEFEGVDYYNFTEYVILDDDSDMLYWQRNNFLLIDRFVGLTMGAVFQAKKILNGGKIIDSREL